MSKRTFLAGALAGAAAAYLLDAKEGGARRARLHGVYTRLERRWLRAGRHAVSEAVGLRRRWEHPHPGRPADDLTLLDRIQSEIYLDPAIPKGEFNLEVVGGITVLRGQLPNQAVIDRVAMAVAAVDGVGAVQNLLHVSGTPAPNKAAAIEASPG